MLDDLLDVVGIGNAIVDIIAPADEAFLRAHGMAKGGMMLVDERKAEEIYGQMASAIIASGGSAANTIAGIASLGGRTAYIGKVRDDEFGRAFRHDITAVGALFRTPPATTGPSTAQCLILVTPDSQRTMNTYLGACANISSDDIDEELIRSAHFTYLEGYLYDDPAAMRAFHSASEIAHAAGRRVALSLSDPFCVERHRGEFLHLVDHHVDVLFGNEAEVTSLFECGWDEAIARLRQLTELAAITRGAAGSVVLSKEGPIEVSPEPVHTIVDTTGAGDLYAAGFLFGLTRGASLRECGRLGSIAAAEIISHYGARPQTALRGLIGQTVSP
ncbi:MAG: adenosine kinase [Candidatus Eremiobacteraeota bacterium]|nr:adenosine kinase [Candidatus Eremiobacteraeota bacterium]MBV8284932.1 adenosine kinase [Candidatus Eremiobacteraeota bacterium]MBV8434247.1 adenosine kinase [Candidatus Eremiobacteraeota bacterium]MBV8654432.1 adenosine kinase [Candidatus Eremiobacteraeota bacterium]